jgi:chromosome segregation ATPase
MSKPIGARSELVAAAEAVEHDVSRLEELSGAARRIRLNTEKNIARAARELQETMEQQERLATGLRAFGEVMVRMQERQQAALEPLSARAVEIQERMTKLSEHMQRFGALGIQASEVAKVLQTLPQAGEEPGSGMTPAAQASALIDVDERFTALVEQAKALAESARAEDFTDIQREADALKQKIHSMRGRLAQLVRAQAAGTS